ncbi:MULTISPECIES: lactonase family protein [Clostridium]|uniref:lactonase family protein n=1 Tax=Clostridium TaxID=1485 RepID=UPI0008245877|nr:MULTISPECIES: lactonase family protein [Clostridium]PJI08297.1 muconate cycloisomerase [Clostridium sp. CT7]
MTNFTVFIGTYTNGKSKGIYSLNIDKKSGEINDLKLAYKLENPTYLALTNHNMYSVIKEGKLGGTASFSIDKLNGCLNFLNSEFAEKNPPIKLEGKQPCYVSLDKSNSYLFSANYHTARVDAFPINKDGSIGSVSSSVTHTGCGPNKERQDTSHIHCAVVTPNNKYLCVIDLGTDKIVNYTFSNGTLSKFNEVKLRPGCGPRHIIFDSEGFAYVVTELSSEVIVLEYSESNCTFKELQYISCVPENYTGENGSAAIHLSKDGNYLYISNRGHNSITCFKRNSLTGLLSLVSHTSTGGLSPRDFDISPSGDFLIAANQDSSNISVFRINKSTGELKIINSNVIIPNPVCVKFAPWEK